MSKNEMSKCIYEDSFTGICFNADCPMRADECPIPDNIPGVCRYEKRETEGSHIKRKDKKDD